MNKICSILILCSLFVAAANADTLSDQANREAAKWVKNYRSNPKEKFARVHLYVQDVVGGPNSTVWEVARSVNTSRSPTVFGLVSVVDDMVTAQPNRTSPQLGRIQGFVAFADFQEVGLAVYLNILFTTGKYNGSTLTLLGRNPIASGRPRELVIVGGTEVFRLARGFSISSTISSEPVENYSVLEHTIYVFYY